MTEEAIDTHKISYFGRELAVVKNSLYDKFYRRLTAGEWEPETFSFLQQHLDKQTVYIDIGSWIGITPLWSSFLAKFVVAVEPEPYCCRVIEALIEKNGIGNVELLKAALSNSEEVELFTVGGAGSSVSSLLPDAKSERVIVRGISVQVINDLAGDNARLVKIDIEGYEYAFGSELCKLAGPKTRGLQIALHPMLIAKSSRWPLPFNRFAAVWQTYTLTKKLAEKFGKAKVRDFSSLWTYLAIGILFRIKPRGTELEFSQLKAGSKNARYIETLDLDQA